MSRDRNDESGYHSVTGQAETTEPDGATSTNTAASSSTTPGHPTSRRTSAAAWQTQSTSSTTTTQALRQKSSTNLAHLNLASAGASPRTSRNTSPVRPDNRPTPLSTPISTQPSAAAIQRALSAANITQLHGTESASRLPRVSKSVSGSGESTPQWATSPRLKSPPPSTVSSRRNSAAAFKKTDTGTTTPSINVLSASPADAPSMVSNPTNDDTSKSSQSVQTPTKAISRGPSGKPTLETVQENSTDEVKEPSPAAIQAATDLKPLTKIAEDDAQPSNQNGTDSEKQTQPGESGSESAGTKSERKRSRAHSISQQQPPRSQRPVTTSKGSYTPSSATKSRQSDGKPNMTVETETVASIPQSAMNAGERSGRRTEDSGSVRLKPSNETIRPKKERKKPSQKARSINQSTASSKADIFEARVAHAVDEVNTSDSDDTFVYESNPPEQPRRPRHHSRTPSVTSAHSMADQQRSGIRNFGDILEERRVAGKRSMKFSNNPYNDVDSPEAKDGSVRSIQPRHFGRFGRGGSHASMFDPDSPYTQASKLKAGQANLRHSRPDSPRSPRSLAQAQHHQQRPSGLFSKKQEQPYDFDVEAGDDERTPLIGTARSNRSARNARRNGSTASHSVHAYYSARRGNRCSRVGGCILGLFVFVAVVLGAVALLFMSNRPMYDVGIRKIQNVLASEEEIMLDLLVGAVNPNALSITVTEMDINIFAKSRHVGSSGQYDADRRRQLLTTSESVSSAERGIQFPSEKPLPSELKPWQDLSEHWRAPSHGIDKGTDPPAGDDDSEREAQTMLLGRIFHFDEGLVFDGSPIRKHTHFAVGELRLQKPGNRTEAGGSARWEKVLGYPFELIIRGVLKYQLPVSSRMQSVSVGSTVLVHPEDGIDSFGNMRTERVDHSEDWQLFDYEDLGRTPVDEGEHEGGTIRYAEE